MPNLELNRESRFFQNLPPDFRMGDDIAELRLLSEYGAVFVARGGVIPPTRVVFADEAEVSRFQSELMITSSEIGGHRIELQSAAMERLLAAIACAERSSRSITPRGADSGRRSYGETIALWRSRVEPALEHWVGKGSLTEEKAEEIRSLSPYEQVAVVFELEEDGIYFARDLSKSIIYSVAPPGASQHLSLLAFDVSEFDDSAVREILAEHFWYQTVVSDLPHFTFLGVPAGELPRLGLRPEKSGGREFWVPDV